MERGEPLGQTGAGPDTDFDHLHLAIFLAKDFNRSRGQNNGPVLQGQEDNSFYLNPLLLYTGNVMGQHEFQSYYTNSTTILQADLHPLSAGGFNSGASEGSDPANYMQAVQSTNPGIEWPNDVYPLEDSAANADGTVTLNTYLLQHFSNYVTSAPNCELQVDTSRSPSRLIVNPTNCDLQDMSQEESLPITPHDYPSGD